MRYFSALALGLAVLPSAAFAHPGHFGPGAFLSGLTHPLGGVDHLLAMLAVGFLAGAMGAKARLALPLAFLGGMIGGAWAGAYGLPLIGVEPMILASIVVLGALLAMGLRAPLAPLALLVAGFGIFHGHAHDAEGPASGLALYASGFVLATAALHGAGIFLCQAKLPQRVIGALTAMSGLALAFA